LLIEPALETIPSFCVQRQIREEPRSQVWTLVERFLVGHHSTKNGMVSKSEDTFCNGKLRFVRMIGCYASLLMRNVVYSEVKHFFTFLPFSRTISIRMIIFPGFPETEVEGVEEAEEITLTLPWSTGPKDRTHQSAQADQKTGLWAREV
jgi:hypothetical protein